MITPSSSLEKTSSDWKDVPFDNIRLVMNYMTISLLEVHH